MPKLLTGDDFMSKVSDHDKAPEAAAQEKEARMDVKKLYEQQMEEYERKAALVKAANERVKSLHVKKLEEWKERKARAKANGTVFKTNQPKRPALECMPEKPTKKSIVIELKAARMDTEMDQSKGNESNKNSDRSDDEGSSLE
ncbi:hypothetical protein K435DRAFT_810874 [Dendrothele bispora CBS 962.96]|uniref:Uncharacterized protein n=1 Tax=Dendrothele bispora (strain CBS 962.96) TaxID=1314807 RepID=A0A4S8KTS9_DENBC|nr:hypothetical protein K435DRAFT_810874 [Dendrothele bispora CBS 962.96]